MMAAFSVSVLLEILRAMIDLNSEKESDNIEKRIYSQKVIVKAKANVSFQMSKDLRKRKQLIFRKQNS